jgi:CRP/FNR family transcriptional regulator, anaerobic regulatory protein
MTPSQEKAAHEMLQFLSSIYLMSPALQADLMEIIQFRQIKRRTHILVEDQVCRDIFFVVKGLLRCYYYTPEGTDVSTWFMREGDVCVSVDSFYKQIKSYEYIVAHEPTLLIYIKFEQLEELFRKHLEFNFVGRVLTVKYLVDWNSQLKDIRLLKTKDRYDALLARDPDLVRRVPRKFIASFLGMLPTSLTRTLDPKKAKKNKNPRKS